MDCAWNNGNRYKRLEGLLQQTFCSEFAQPLLNEYALSGSLFGWQVSSTGRSWILRVCLRKRPISLSLECSPILSLSVAFNAFYERFVALDVLSQGAGFSDITNLIGKYDGRERNNCFIKFL